MGSIRAINQQQVMLPPARCLVGRSRACDLILTDLAVSSQHAVLQWTGSCWEVQDLGSRNGTYVGDHRLAAGERFALAAGSRFRFARGGGEWSLDDASPPRPMALNLESGRVQLAERGMLMLPDAERPEVLLQAEASGRWIVALDGEVADVSDRATLTVAGETWRLYLSIAADGTQEPEERGLRLRDLRLRFVHSLNEEYIELTATTRDRRIDLQARAHNYMLYVLARVRLADQAGGLGLADQGWISPEKLCDMLKIEAPHLNITIHRARLHLAQNGVTDAASLVERRKGTRQLRIGVAALEIVPL